MKTLFALFVVAISTNLCAQQDDLLPIQPANCIEETSDLDGNCTLNCNGNPFSDRDE